MGKRNRIDLKNEKRYQLYDNDKYTAKLTNESLRQMCGEQRIVTCKAIECKSIKEAWCNEAESNRIECKSVKEAYP